MRLEIQHYFNNVDIRNVNVNFSWIVDITFYKVQAETTVYLSVCFREIANNLLHDTVGFKL